MSRITGIFLALALPILAFAQGGDQQLRTKADGLFSQGRFAEAYPLYSQLVSLSPSDRELNYRFGACTLYGGDDKEKAIGHLKFACEVSTTSPLAWYFLGRSYHLAYRFKEALAAYEHYKGTADKKVLAQYPADALEQQCRNGLQLLSNLKEIRVHSKLEVDAAEFFRFYDLAGIGGRIVVTPEELLSSLDKKSGVRSLIYIPEKGGAIYFSSLGKDGRTGRDIYRTELLPTGQFAEPAKLAGYVNTDQDEDYPFLSADGRYFYFASKGHNSMGGYDVFRTSYDKGLDVFSAPENLDFAVNTPDDDLFYMVDPEGKEACFASGRSSHQGKLHVYRVSTAQTPINITVIKGTFASELDVKDRKAHILVEDAMTRERVADVRTDMNGGYVLALPRSGRYRFLVEAGPSGRTHVGYVEVPRNETARAYRQEMSLVEQAAQEKLMIRNYFEEPLSEDLIALALDEIKRRAQLNVTTAPTAQPVAETPADVMTAAGFTGDVTKEQAVKLAEDDARELGAKAEDLGRMSEAAYSIALDNAAESERTAAQAAALVTEANATADETRRNELMMEAARKRQASREANLRARAAYSTGQDLTTQRLSATQRAANATKLASDLSTSVKANDDAKALVALRELKARMDVKGGPDGDLAPAEMARRAATETEKEASKAAQQARSKSEEESELVDRINRLKREQQAAGSKSKKEELGREIAQYEEQLTYLREEVATSVAKARTAEERSAVGKGEAQLTRYLEEKGDGLPVTALDAERVTALGQMIAGNTSRIGALGIDERYEAAIADEVAVSAQRTFDWGAGPDTETASTDGGSRTSTRTADDQQAAGSTVTQTSGGTQELAQTSSEQGQQAGTQATPQGAALTTGVAVAAVAAGSRTSDGQQVGDPSVTVTSSGAQDTAQRSDGQGQQAGQVQDGGPGAATATAQTRDTVPARSDEELVSMRGVGDVDATNADAAFVQANELAELKQLRDAERNRSKRDSLDRRIAALELAAQQPVEAQVTAQAAEEADEPPVGAAREFAGGATSAELENMLYAEYAQDRDRIATGTLNAQQRTMSLHGLELMLVDSIEAETARQLAVLDADPTRAMEVLPRVDRLRQLKEEHLFEADRILAANDQQYAAQETRGMEQAMQAGMDQRSAVDAGTEGTGTAHVDRYVSVATESEYVYESVVEHRSTDVGEALREKDRDLERIVALGDEIDSLETVLEEMPEGRERDKLRDRTDRKIDEEMVLRMEMGQRMAYISRTEYQAGRDSLVEVTTIVSTKGLAPSEPLVLMATELERSAATHFAGALAKRKEADRIEDIVKRDQLYREAYQEELMALRELDKAITVNNHLLSERFAPGVTRSYAEVEQHMFGTETAAPMADAGVGTKPTITERNVRSMSGDSALAMTTKADSLLGQAPAKADLTRYQSFMTEEAAPSGVPAALAVDVSALALQSGQAREEARRLEERSLDLSDQALATRDSAATAKKRDRERLEMEAARLQQRSDSLHEASLAMERKAQELDLKQQEAADAQAFQARLRKYYYLGSEDQLMVMNEMDHSRYFMARTRSLEQQQQASSAQLESKASRQLADTLLTEATSLLATPDLPDGRLSEARLAQAKMLSERAVELHDRSDSLSAAAERLKGAADLNDRQAGMLLQGMSPERSTEIMALEQRTRRTDALIAESRTLIAQVDTLRAQEIAQARAQGREPSAGALNAAPAGGAERPVAEVPVAPVNNPTTAAAVPVERVVPGPVAPPPGAFVVPEVLTTDIFGMREAGAPATPIAVDQPMPKGVVFKVQIGAFKNEIPKELFNDMTPVMGETTANGVTRYTAGLFTTPEAAEKARALVRERGYRDAFVVAYEEGKRVPLSQAVRAMQPVQPAPAIAAAPPTERPAAVIQAPPPAVTTAVPDDAQVLAAYPSTAEEVLKQFAPPVDATTYYNDPTAAPARQVETVKGLFFTVQVGVYSKPTALDKLFNITPLNSERTETGKIRYTTGVFLDLEKARVRKDGTVVLGVKDAFITAYLNGKRIPMRDAKALLQKFGPGVLADPSLATP